jgi:hypothetical protein
MLTLSISTLTVDLQYALNAELPRTRIDITNPVRPTATGSIVGGGIQYEPQHIWNCEILCNEEQMRLLKLIYAEHDYRRRTQTADPNVLVWDTSQLYEERSPQTREEVPGTTIISYPDVGLATHLLYYAQFKAWFTSAPTIAKQGNLGVFYSVRFALQETDKVVVV